MKSSSSFSNHPYCFKCLEESDRLVADEVRRSLCATEGALEAARSRERALDEALSLAAARAEKDRVCHTTASAFAERRLALAEEHLAEVEKRAAKLQRECQHSEQLERTAAAATANESSRLVSDKSDGANHRETLRRPPGFRRSRKTRHASRV